LCSTSPGWEAFAALVHGRIEILPEDKADPNMTKTPNDSMAFSTDGHRLPLTSDEVRAKVDAALTDPACELLFCVLHDTRTGDVLAPVLGPPSLATYEAMRDALRGYRRSLRALGLKV
jgi:hypothetical protein